MDKVNAFKATVSAVCAALTALWGWFGWVVFAWVCFMAIDYLTGSAAACKNGEWSSAVAREGIWHKAGEIVAVMVAGLLDLVVGHLLGNIPVTLPFAYTVLICPLVVTWYILTEAGSIIENAGALGAPIPSWMAKTVDALQDAVDEAGDKITPEEEDK
ncbi:phage holin family protein [Pseudoflavonifractor phocaeensis]|uniref:phage holin family protein n=1 Tax=Pseudoflavonifractor phocaeensis TaxID=1870988 RepID=UPI00195779A6|nr:phage holin family protein [Pseudoflavonifractor phocaeensis]MBM6936916.1 phage holin family protein [Pseudoflavonifractor phocaeensis]